MVIIIDQDEKGLFYSTKIHDIHHNNDKYNNVINNKYVTIKKEEWIVPDEYDGVVPLCAGEKLKWKYIF